ncbi:hypothetical protein C8R44DRAFT_748992 [Mycena epipterygia]|nr:hypothetical protein C8R44DRAFT_748992 [Mycena epipterygia]
MPKPSPRRISTPALPPELWIYIHRLAVSHISPDESKDDPLNDRDMQRFLQAARSLARVCRLWNDLARDILYENVLVNKRFASLSAALEQPETARLVRNIRLSTTRFDRNAVILRHCPDVELLVQPEFPRPERLYAFPPAPLPPFPRLKRLHWIESWWSAALLLRVLSAAPNLMHLTLASSHTIGSDHTTLCAFPPLPRLASLSVVRLNRACVHALLHTELPSLIYLTIDPASLLPAPFPALHTLVLEPYPAAMRVPFPTLAPPNFPCLRELQYNVLTYRPPTEKATLPALACVRLHLPLEAQWAHVETHFRVFLEGPQAVFPALARVVLEGRWEELCAEPEFAVVREQLRMRGCRIEFPEGRVLGDP